MPLRAFFLPILLTLSLAGPAAAATQSPIDQANPSVIEEELRQVEPPERASQMPPRLETIAPSAVELDHTIMVGAIRIEGASAIPAAVFAPIIDAYVGRTLSSDDLKALASDIATIARTRGYGLATAWIPAQKITNGIIRVVLDEGRIDEVRVQGGASAPVTRILSALATGEPVKTAQLERQLLLAGDLQGVRLGKARLQRIDGRRVLVVTADRDRVRGRATLDNWGSKEVGPLRARLSTDINGLLAQDDRLSIGTMVTPLQPREFGLVSLAYSKVLGTSGTEVHVSGYHAKTEAGGILKGRDIDGRSSYAEVGVSRPLLRSRPVSLWAYLDFGILGATQSRRGVTFSDDRIAALSASLYGTAAVASGRLRGRLTYKRGLNLFDATTGGDRLASRRDGSAIFSKLEFWAGYDRSLGANLSIALQLEGQLASRALLSSEEMGLGGRYFLRGYESRERSGDDGVAGSAELRWDVGLSNDASAQFYAYVDGGEVDNHRDGFGSGSLASAGGGVRVQLDRVEAGLEVGVPLRKAAYSGEENDPRISYTLATRF
ncbi:MAG: ShlB/FhaC/HecB family hemolysin secretion/activation protein [Alphaproteobacteria bacterium]|nr:ShlB/FhaC/HecB family hemolysin secretion/activation protein [Alphaproteobacteria bacterium]